MPEVVLTRKEMQRVSVIRTLILRESVKMGVGYDMIDSAELLGCLTSNETRGTVYACCLELAEEDAQRRAVMGSLITSYLPCFPPGIETLGAIRARSVEYCHHKSAYSPLYAQLLQMVNATLSARPFAFLLSRAPQRSEKMMTRGLKYDQSPEYISKFGLQANLDAASVANSASAMSGPRAEQERAALLAIAAEKNAALGVSRPIAVPCNRCKAYVDQFPSETTPAMMEEQLGILANFWDRYRSNPVVINATLFLIKQVCDGYVSKLPLGKPYVLFRSVTVALLPTLFSWMDSDYMCVRNHVYDFVLNLGLHLQVVDPDGRYPGVTATLQQELVWLLARLLHRQALKKPYDVMTWTAAAKCVLATTPQRYRHIFDVRALQQFLELPPLAATQPHLFAVFAESFAACLFSDKQYDAAPEMNLVIDEEELAKVGLESALRTLFDAYRRSRSVGPRRALFRLLFALAVRDLRDTDEAFVGVATADSVRRCYLSLVSLDLFWFLHPLLFYQSHRVLLNLPAQIIYDLDFKDLRENRTVVVSIVQRILQMIAAEARIPDFITSEFARASEREAAEAAVATATAMDQGVYVRQLLDSAARALPLLLKEDSRSPQQHLGWRLALYCVRSCKEHLPPDASAAAIDGLLAELMSSTVATDAGDRERIRRCCPSLLASLLVLARARPAAVMDVVARLLERLLFTAERTPAAHFMAVYACLIDHATACVGPLHRSPGTASLAGAAQLRGAVVQHASAESVGPRVLWALYRGLRGDQSAAVCHARRTLVDMLACDPHQRQAVHLRAWRGLMEDPYPAVALTAAKMVLAIRGATETKGADLTGIYAAAKASSPSR